MKRGAGRGEPLSRQYYQQKQQQPPQPSRQRQHRLDHESKDEFNEDTFGETALSGLDNEFHFGTALPPTDRRMDEARGRSPRFAAPPSLGDIDPAIAMVTTAAGGAKVSSPHLSSLPRRVVHEGERDAGSQARDKLDFDPNNQDVDDNDDERPPGMSPDMNSMDFDSGAGMGSLASGPTHHRGGRPPAPPIAPSAGTPDMMLLSRTLLSSPRRVLTLDEIEARLSQISLPTSSSGSTNHDGRWLVLRNRTKSTIITFPRYADDDRTDNDPFQVTDEPSRLGHIDGERGATRDDEEERSLPPSRKETAEQGRPCWERNRWILTKFEREGVARIHLSQLSTEHAEVEDYYYRAYAKRASLRRGGADGGIAPPLYLPLPTPRRRERGGGGGGDRDRDRPERGEWSERDRSGGTPNRADTTGRQPTGQAALMREALASALGKKSASSSKRPRQQLVVPTLTTDSETMPSNGATYSTSAAVELIYQAVFRVEDALSASGPTSSPALVDESKGEGRTASEEEGGNLTRLQECRREAIDVIDQQLGLKLSLQELSQGQTKGGTTGLTRFLGILALPKAKKIIGRALKAIDSVRLSERLLTRLVELFEYLDVCRVDASETDINLFVNCLLAGLVPHVAKAAGWEEIESKLQLMVTKNSLPWIAGTKAGLVLLCILLSRGEILKAGGATDEESRVTRWSTLVEHLFDQLSDRLAELFGSLQGADGEFYGWQFMALLALNVEADRKRQMVMELRERILATANASDQVAIDNLNIFLNALGLDASHLRGEQ